MRKKIKRFIRQPNAFGKKIENHTFHLALHYMYYNFVRIHKTLRMTQAVKAGAKDRLWSVEEIAGLLDSKCVTTDGLMIFHFGII